MQIVGAIEFNELLEHVGEHWLIEGVETIRGVKRVRRRGL